LLASSDKGDTWHDVTDNLCYPFIPYPSGLGQNDQGYYFVSCGVSGFWRSISFTSLVGIDNNSLSTTSEVSIFPNPTAGSCYINVSNEPDFISLTVKNIEGKSLQKIETDLIHMPFELYLNNFSPGMYLVEISTPKWKVISKVLKI